VIDRYQQYYMLIKERLLLSSYQSGKIKIIRIGGRHMKINEQAIREACHHLANTLVQKNQDYGNSVEEQFKEYGDASINLRLEDKLRRLKNLAKNEAQVNEKKSETVLDSAGYAMLAYILYECTE
jgi:hypothetical protein